MGNYYSGMINNSGGYGELKHHGILGQKWGVRRFQNSDGSLTAAGRERYVTNSIPKTVMQKNSLHDRISNLYNGRTNGETDSTKVKDSALRRQMNNNIRSNTRLQDNWDFRGKSARKERDLSKNFVKTSVKEFNSSKKDQKTLQKAKADAEKYMRNVAEIRLKSMGYEVTDKAIDNLVSKDWFKNSLWIQNTLASMGADGVDYTSKDDMSFR